MANRTVSNVIGRVRALLEDTRADSYRYSSDDLLNGVNDAFLEVRRIRPDLYIHKGFDVDDLTVDSVFPIDVQYFMAVVYLTAGHVMLRDDPNSNDSRAVSLLNKGISQLQSTAA